MKSKSIIRLALFISFAALTTFAAPVTIMDDYYGGNDHGYGDVIGTSVFDIEKMVVDHSGSSLSVSIYSNYFAAKGDDIYGTVAGDLFISTDGWNPAGTSADHYINDNIANGTVWEYGLRILSDTSCELIDLTGGTYEDLILTSDEAYGVDHPNMIYRNGQEVKIHPAPKSIAEGALSYCDDKSCLTFSIANDIFANSDDLAFHWTMTCGNDVIEGAAPVPEPATMILLGFGLLGLAGTKRRKHTK